MYKNALINHWQQLASMALLLAKIVSFSALAEEIEKSPWTFSGAIRGSFQYLDYNPARQAQFEFDTLRGAVAYDDGTLIGSGQIRYYRYSHRQTGGTKPGNMVFLQHLWAGFRFNDRSELTVGLNSHPFGLYPYAGNNFFESMAYYVGYEDTQSLGVKYSRQDGHLETQLAFYPNDGGQGWASVAAGNWLEKESTRYSFHAVNGNKERNTFVARLVYGIEHSQDFKSEWGVSYLNGKIASTIDQKGHREAMAVHYVGSFSNLGVKLQAVHYDNQLNGAPTTMLIGAYGFSNKLATKANIYIANLSYRFDGSLGPFSDFTLYNDYSLLDKSAAGFINSSQNVTGLSFGAGKWWIYVDYMLGKNSPYMSAVFYNGLGSGAQTHNSGQRFNISFGYYF